MEPHKIIILLVSVWSVLLLQCSIQQEVAGNASQVGSLQATLVYQDGSRASQVEVVVHPSSFFAGITPAPLAKTTSLSDTVSTDQKGRLRIQDLEFGTYTLVARDKKGKALLLSGIAVSDTAPDQDLGTNILKATGSLSGSTHLQAGGRPENTMVAALGTDYYSRPDSTGLFTLEDLAPGSYTLLLYTTPEGYENIQVDAQAVSGTRSDIGGQEVAERSESFSRTIADFSSVTTERTYSQQGLVDSVVPEVDWKERWLRYGIDAFDNIDTLILRQHSYELRFSDRDYHTSKAKMSFQQWGSYNFALGNICLQPEKEFKGADTLLLPPGQPATCYVWANQGIEKKGCVDQREFLDTAADTMVFQSDHYHRPCDEIYPSKNHNLDTLTLIDFWMRME